LSVFIEVPVETIDKIIATERGNGMNQMLMFKEVWH
jgi:hypothetical protein